MKQAQREGGPEDGAGGLAEGRLARPRRRGVRGWVSRPLFGALAPLGATASLGAAAGLGITSALAAVAAFSGALPSLAASPPASAGWEIAATAPHPLPPAREGKAAYLTRCASCHGGAGRGDGAAGVHLDPPPRDLTSGVFKLRTTPAGAPPTDADVFRTLTRGIPSAGMPGCAALPARTRWALVAYVESLAPHTDWAHRPAPIVVPPPPPSSPASVAAGRLVYARARCASCHGEKGDGHGPASTQLRDDWGHRLRAADLTRPDSWRGGGTPRDLFRAIAVGLNGTPMPGFASELPEADRWRLVHYVLSMRR